MAGALAKLQAGKIRIEVVTPTGMVLSEMVDEFTAPSVEGEFGVLPGHIPLLAALRIGLVTYRKGAETLACAVGSGFVEVADDYALLLTDKFMTKDKIDVVATRLALKEVDEKLSNWTEAPGTPKHQEAIAEEQWQVAILTLFGDPPPPVMRGWEPNKEEAAEPTEPADNA
ncbi:MAG: ATP synthase F1 subunit epsilon [Deltaproteobacteria bacterium]|nr:ATP synthase F1 subunit epsilon [Deltaproteobacteria bacterium]